jgi:FkbM family methyltransferase
LERLLQFRLTLDPAHTLAAYSPNVRHYFDPGALQLGQDETFVDGGGYDGDTTRDFVAETGGRYRTVHLFEPDPKLLDAARKSLAAAHDIVFHPHALHTHATTLRFAPGEMDGAITDQGQLEVPAVSLDDAVKEPVSLIKLDVEGAEREALAGAAQHIANDRPKLALSVYHLAGDFWRLPDQVAGYRSGYELRLRHYSESVIDSVLYCV